MLRVRVLHGNIVATCREMTVVLRMVSRERISLWYLRAVVSSISTWYPSASKLRRSKQPCVYSRVSCLLLGIPQPLWNRFLFHSSLFNCNRTNFILLITSILGEQIYSDKFINSTGVNFKNYRSFRWEIVPKS